MARTSNAQGMKRSEARGQERRSRQGDRLAMASTQSIKLEMDWQVMARRLDRWLPR